jgi:hypothetical protein
MAAVSYVGLLRRWAVVALLWFAASSIIDVAALSTTACQSRSVSIRCPENTAVRVQSAFYGRKDTTTCVAEAQAAGYGPAAWANSKCSFAGALVNVKTACDGMSVCAVDNTIWKADPCAGTFKYGVITYTCDTASRFLDGRAPSPGSDLLTLIAVVNLVVHLANTLSTGAFPRKGANTGSTSCAKWCAQQIDQSGLFPGCHYGMDDITGEVYGCSTVRGVKEVDCTCSWGRQ